MTVSIVYVISAFLIFIIGAYSLISVFYPVWPFRSRKRAATTVGISLAAFVVITVIAYPFLPKHDAATDAAVEVISGPKDAEDQLDNGTSQSALRSETPFGSDIPSACGTSGLAIGDVVTASGEEVIRIAPETTAALLKNKKATKALGEETFHRIDSSVTARRLCVELEWTEIQIVEPDHLSFVRGWVPNTALREIEKDTAGARIFVEDDFYWDEDSKNFKPEIVAIINRISRENENCQMTDSYSVMLSPTRSAPGDPVFFVACRSGHEVFNVWFRPSDAGGNTDFSSTEPLERGAAVNACEEAARAAAVRPETVRFSRLIDLAYVPFASGRVRVVSSFTAKSISDIEIGYRISCLFDGPAMIDTQISESLQ